MSGRPKSAPLVGLCGLARRRLPIDGASVVLIGSGGHRDLIGAAGGVAKELEEITQVCMEGPCVDAPETGEPVIVADLRVPESRERWPIFTSEAQRYGVAAIAAAPVQIGVIRLGVMVTHSRIPGYLDPADQAELFTLADTAAFLLLDLLPTGAGAADGVDVLDHDPVGDIDGRSVPTIEPLGYVSSEIHQASGMVMVQLGISIEAALARLRAYAFANDRSLAEVARAVVSRELRFEE